MKTLLSTTVFSIFATLMVAMLSAPQALAKKETSSFRWIAGDDAFLGCEMPACPDAAIAASTGDMIEISGNGELTLHPKSINGGGEFWASALEQFGGPVEGTWEAVELLSFQAYGASPILPPDLRPGNAMIRIRLYDTEDDWVADAVLRLGCRLPEANFPPSTIEGVRVNIQGGLNFNLEIDPRGTLFIALD